MVDNNVKLQPGDYAEAHLIAYKTGITSLEPVLLRIFNLERIVTEQQTTIAALQSTVLALKHGRAVKDN